MNRCNKILKEKLIKDGTQNFLMKRKQHTRRSYEYLADKQKVPLSVQMYLSLERQDY
jgi:hypothetical protein